MSHIRVSGLHDRVEIDVDDLIQVAGHHLRDLIELGKIVSDITGVIVFYEGRQVDGGKIAHSYLNTYQTEV